MTYTYEDTRTQKHYQERGDWNGKKLMICMETGTLELVSYETMSQYYRDSVSCMQERMNQ